jgi:hypothetical protein
MRRHVPRPQARTVAAAVPACEQPPAVPLAAAPLVGKKRRKRTPDLARTSFAVTTWVGPYAFRDRAPLVDLITAMIAPQAWRSVGDPGVIAPTATGLQIQQTYHSQRMSEQLLGDLRQTLRG